MNNKYAEQFLERYRLFFQFPVIEDPDFIHTSPNLLIPGEKLEKSRAEFCKNKDFCLEAAFEELRQKEFPERPSRLNCIFLWSKESYGKITPLELIKPTKKNSRKILEEYMPGSYPAFCYATQIPEGSLIFYGNWSIINGLMAPVSSQWPVSSYKEMDGRELKEYIRRYWREDMGKNQSQEQVEVLVGKDIEIKGVLPYIFT